MKNNCYIVEAKCGHVGRGNCIIIAFAIEAVSAKAAAKAVRWFPRVKHDRKDAIVSVTECDRKTYMAQLKANNEDPFLHCKSSRDQKRLCPNIWESVIASHKEKAIDPMIRKEKIAYRRKRSTLSSRGAAVRTLGSESNLDWAEE